MDPFKVPKEQAKVVLNLPPQPPMEVDIFLSPFAEHHQGQETVSDLIRGGTPFLPILSSGGQSILVRKKAIRSLKLLDPERVEWLYFEARSGSPPRRISLLFGDGAKMEGLIYATTPVGHQRVSDVINLTGPFIHLEAQDGVYLVNLGHVSTIRIVEEIRGDAG